MSLHCAVGIADGTQAEVVGPTRELPVERFYQRFRILLGVTRSRHFADRLTRAVYSFLGRSPAPIGLPCLLRVTSAPRIPAQIERFSRQSPEPRPTSIHLQLQPRHPTPH